MVISIGHYHFIISLRSIGKFGSNCRHHLHKILDIDRFFHYIFIYHNIIILLILPKLPSHPMAFSKLFRSEKFQAFLALDLFHLQPSFLFKSHQPFGVWCFLFSCPQLSSFLLTCQFCSSIWWIRLCILSCVPCSKDN